jgi:hypothetical protein
MDPERRPRQLHPRWNPPEPRHDHFKVALDRGEVGAGLVDLAQGKRVFVRHALICARGMVNRRSTVPTRARRAPSSALPRRGDNR